MKVSRELLLAVLKTVAPALSSNKNQVDELSHIWFDGDYVSAFDDLIGIRVEFQTDFKGGIKGDKLIGMLDNSRAKDVTITEEENHNLKMKFGRTNVDLTLKPLKLMIWNDDVPDMQAYTITEAFLSSMKMVLLSVGAQKIMNPEQRGVTVIQKRDYADFYSTDSTTISWKQVATDKSPIIDPDIGDRIIIPTPFCEQVRALVKPGAELIVDHNNVFCLANIELDAEHETAEVMLFANLVLDENPDEHDFEAVIGEYIATNTAFEVPQGLKLSLDRALVLLSEGEPVHVQVDQDILVLYAETELGKYDDEMSITVDGHPDITVKLNPALIKRAVEDRETMAVTKGCLIMSGPQGFVHIIATV